MNSEKTSQAVAEAETKYQTLEKEKQILEQENDILALQTKQDRITRRYNFILGGGAFLALLGFFAIRFNRIKKERNDKKAFATALILAQEEERKRIARDLHDGVGQSLLLLSKQLQDTQSIALENQRMAIEALEEVRTISKDLHPIHLEKFGLTFSIENIIEKIEASTDLFITQEIENIDQLLNPKAEIHLFRTIQEALSNVVKHSSATAANISIQKVDNEIKILIQDNGKGFDFENTQLISKSLGLRTMQERISAVDGLLKISKGKSNGTVIEIKVPRNTQLKIA